MLFVLVIAVLLHLNLVCFNSYCTLNPANRLLYQ